MLYYVFGLWYFGFYLSGKALDNWLVSKNILIRKSTAWWLLMSFWGAMSLGSIMFLGEFVYRIFIPYGLRK